MVKIATCEHLSRPLTFQYQNRRYSVNNQRDIIIASVALAIFTLLLGGLIFFYLLTLKLKKIQIKELKEFDKNMLQLKQAFHTVINEGTESGESTPETPRTPRSDHIDIIPEGDEESQALAYEILRRYNHNLGDLHQLSTEQVQKEFFKLNKVTSRYSKNIPKVSLSKNDRFSDNQPYDDETLVSLPSERYINASWTIDQGYIATQAPMPHTMLEFLEMTQFYKVKHVVMLTGAKPLDSFADKNEFYSTPFQYWPEFPDQTMKFPPFTLTLKDEKAKTLDSETTLVKRTLEVRTLEGHHEFTHYQIPDWPDGGVIPPAALLKAIKFIDKQVDKDDSSTESPLIVHCTAGIGRTGTFVAVHRSLKRLKKKDTLNVAELVFDMRQDKPGFVQSSAQYGLIISSLALATSA